MLECHHIAGDEDFLLKVVAASPLDYEKFVLEKLTAIEGVQRVKTTVRPLLAQKRDRPSPLGVSL